MRWFIDTLRHFFIFSSIIILGLTLWPLLYPQIRYYYDQWFRYKYFSRQIPTDVQGGELSPFAEMLKEDTPLRLNPVNKEFSIVIDKIGISAPIVANVSMVDSNDYKAALKIGVAHAKGSSPPGSGLTYLFAHSSLDFWQLGGYATVFNLIGKLDKGDRVVVFYLGEQYNYYVVNKETVRGWDVGPFYKEVNVPTLVLQTCTPPGTTINRVIVTAELGK